MRFSITAKYLTGVFLILAVVIIPMTLFTIDREEEILRKNQYSFSSATSQILSNLIYEETNRISGNPLNDRLKRIVSPINNLINFTIINRKGEIRYQFVEEQLAQSFFDSTHLQILKSRFWEDKTRLLIAFSDKKEYTIVTPIIVDDTDLSSMDSQMFKGIVVFKYSLENILSEIESTKKQIIYLTMIFIVIGLSFSLISARFLIKSIAELRKISLEFNSGNYSTRVTSFSKDEVGDLSRAFNEMADSIQTSFRDLNLQKVSLEYLTQQAVNGESRIRHLFDNASDGIIHINLNNEMIYFNRMVIEIIGIEIQDNHDHFDYYILPEYVKDYRQFIEQISNETIVNQSLILALKSPSGKISEIELKGSKIENDGEVIIQLFIRDVTEKKILQEQLIQARKMESIGRLAGGVAHDFNNLLAVIIPNAELIKIRNSDPKIQAQLDQILSAGKRATEVVRQLLNFSRQKVVNFKPESLHKAIESTVKLISELIPEKVKIETEFYAENHMIQMDETQMQQVIMNLAVNARDAMPNGGTLVFNTTNVVKDKNKIPTDMICLSVTDSGVGINKENMKRIFEPFFTTKNVGEGTGLGLAGVYGIVQQHQGFIEVTSEEGSGTSFYLYFPLIITKGNS